ncbi:Protein of uncharacterised function (DUF2812) [Mycobacteroides abscessus subsp. abscessus]|nr:Protein of uncharacterised function (DUF2812) [Mycobacteroides abscessus subsp. abscessus]
MIKKVKKNTFKNFFIHIEKEEAWLNHMCKKGYALQEISDGYYVFEASTPSRYIYRIEFLKQEVFQKEKDEYVALMQELKVEQVASNKRWHYFRRDASLGEFEIYSDIDSQIEHYQRINFIWYILAFIFIYSGISQVFLFRDIHTFEMILNTVLVIIGIFFLILGFPLTKKIHALKKRKNLFQ